jgi:uncharacterized repeat protein (TIGR01451 family)
MADLAVSVSDAPDPVVAGNNLTYTITLTNNGPDAAQNVSLSDALPANTTFVLFGAPVGWTTTTPAAGGTGTVSATLASLSSGVPATSATFTLVVNVGVGVAGGTTISDTASATTATNDPFSGNNAATAPTTVNPAPVPMADLEIANPSATPNPVAPGGQITYTVFVTNHGPDSAANVVTMVQVPAHTSFVSFSAPPGVMVNAPAAGTAGPATITATVPAVPAGRAEGFTLVVQVDASAANGMVITNTASVSSATSDPVATNNSLTRQVTVMVPVIQLPNPVTVTSVSIQNAKLGKIKTSQILIHFSDALNGGVARALSAYQLTNVVLGKKPSTKPIALAQGSYNAQAHTVTLTTRKPLKFTPKAHLQLMIFAKSVLDTLGRQLDGDHDGIVGGDYTATLTRSGAVGIRAARHAGP